MKRIKKIFICPIPNDQKPIFDYIKFKNNVLLRNFVFIYLSGIRMKLISPNLIYEEGSWYDGQIWEKSFFLIKNDRLINLKLFQILKKKNRKDFK